LSLNETGAATLFLDGSGQGNHGTCMGASCPQAGVWSSRGKAAQFDGVNDQIVTLAEIDQSSGSPGATMMAWVRPIGTTDDIEVVLSTDDGGLDWSIARWGSNWVVYSGESAPGTGFSVRLNQWQHVAAVFEPARGRIRFYRNGQERVISRIGYDTSDNPVVIGDNAGPWENFFEGRIDEVQVYSRPLSAEEVRAIYRGDAEVSWLSWNVSHGRVPGLDTRTIQFTLDATGLQADTYTARVAVASNDPDDSRVNVAVTMVVTDQAPRIEVTPARLAGEVLQGRSLARTLTISNTGTAALTYQLATRPPASAGWLEMVPTGGTVPRGRAQEVEVTLDAAELEPGVHRAWIQVQSNDPDSPLVEVPVVLTVLVAAPQIAVRPASLDETLAQGATLNRTLTISNTGTADLEFELSTLSGVGAALRAEEVSWLTVDPISGTVSAGGEQAIRVTLDATGVPVGDHSAIIRIQSDDPVTPTLDVPVTMTVQEAADLGRVQGTVTDALSGAPLAATVSVLGQPDSTTTDGSGAYELWLEAGAYTLQVTAAGYLAERAEVQIVAQQTTAQDFALYPLGAYHLYLPLVFQ
jgi:hypothetical protein